MFVDRRITTTMSAVAALLTALTFASPAADAAADLDHAAITGLSASLVKVEAVDADGRVWLGTGVGVAPEHVVTSCHVTRRAANVVVQYRGARQAVTAQLADIEHDLCLLLVPDLGVAPAKLGAPGALNVGTAVFALGYEGGFGLRARGGIVRAMHAYDGARVIESTTPFTSGASGGALFDSQGNLVGILTYRLRGDRRSYFSVPVEWFASRLVSEQHYSSIAPLEGALPFWQRAQDGLPYFLRAHQLETGGDWNGLLALTDEWARRESGNAEAWLFRGKSLIETQDPVAARAAYQHAIFLDPVSSAAWLQLGRLSMHGGLAQDAEAALMQLNRLNSELAECLAAEMRQDATSAAVDDDVRDACAAL